MDDVAGRIKNELSIALERLGADPRLLAIIGSWGDTLSDAEALELLQDWNAGRLKWLSLAGDRRRRPKIRIVR